MTALIVTVVVPVPDGTDDVNPSGTDKLQDCDSFVFIVNCFDSPAAVKDNDDVDNDNDPSGCASDIIYTVFGSFVCIALCGLFHVHIWLFY